jgi:hypothetical protein
MTWAGDTEHRHLLDVAQQLINELYGLRQRLVSNEVFYFQHGEFADRASSLAGYLQAALVTMQEDLYIPAFANLRSALEHVLMDFLVFLGRRYIQIIDGVDETTWNEWKSRRETGDHFKHVVEWTRTRKGLVEITYDGMHSSASDGEATSLGIHYFLLQQYQPYFGPPSAQDQFDDGIGDPLSSKDFAKQNEALYRTYLNWRSIKKSLLVNGFVTNSDLEKFEVHYRFLSAFVHPISDVRDLVYGRNSYSIEYDHYSSELILLYIIVFAVEELRHFRSMSRGNPQVEIRHWQQTQEYCTRAWNYVSYMWFPGHLPNAYDRITEANTRMFRMIGDGLDRQFIDPNSIPADEVGYYRDPLRRLIGLHSGFHEMMTSLSFVSPWLRRDAQFR